MVIVHQPLAAAELKRARQDPRHVLRWAVKPQGNATQGEGELSGAQFEWFIRALSVAQRLLFESPGFAPLARRADELNEEYDCGDDGSPVLDSFFLPHVLADRTQGFASESPLSVCAFVLRHLGAPTELVSHAEALSESRLHVVWCEAAGDLVGEPRTARLRCPVTGRQWQVEVADPWFRVGLGYLVRIIELPGRDVVLTTPYALLTSEAEWREYFARQLSVPEQESAGGKGAAPKGKRKKPKRAPAGAANSPAQRLYRHMKRGPWPDHWIDFVNEAFAGSVNGCPALGGVPDLPETIPGDPEFDERQEQRWLELLDDDDDDDAGDAMGARAADIPLALRIRLACAVTVREPPAPDDPPLVRLRRLLIEQVFADKLHEEVAEDCERVCKALGADTLSLEHPGGYQLLAAYAFFGLPGRRRKSALERLLDSGRLDEEERALAEEHRCARFSLFEIVTVAPDEGLEVYDLLQEKKLWIRERLFTHQASVGMVLAGWLLDGQEPLTFEGSLFPMSFDTGTQVFERLRSLRSPERRLVPAAVAVIDSVTNPFEKIRVHTSDGQELVFCRARYDVLDAEDVRGRLEAWLGPAEGGRFRIIDERDIVVASLQLAGSTLTLETHSKERLEEWKAETSRRLGESARHRLDSLEDASEVSPADLRAASAERGGIPAEAVSPELQEALGPAILEQIRRAMRGPIPMFGDRSLVQLVETERGREQARAWLLSQQEILRSQPLLAQISLEPLWRELGLDYEE
jgi:hypothetical protein